MPRKGSRLVEFILERLYNKKYPNVLFWINEPQKVLAIRITRKSSKDYYKEQDAFFEEWSLERGHGSDPANNRQRFLQAVKRSKFLIKCEPEGWIDEELSKGLLLLKLAEIPQEMDSEPLVEQPQKMDSEPLKQVEEMDMEFSEQKSTHFTISEEIENIEVVIPDMPVDDIKLPLDYDPSEEFQNACRQIHTVPNVPVIQPEVDSSDSPSYELDVYTTDSVDGGGVIVKEKVSLNNPVTPSSSYMVVYKPK